MPTSQNVRRHDAREAVCARALAIYLHFPVGPPHSNVMGHSVGAADRQQSPGRVYHMAIHYLSAMWYTFFVSYYSVVFCGPCDGSH